MSEVRGVAAARFAEAVHRVAVHVDEAKLALGAQLCVIEGGHVVVDVALGDDGLGRPVEADTLFALYCTTKPVTSVAVARLVAEGMVSYDTTVGEVLGSACGPGVAPLTLRQLLTHSAGLHGLDAKLAVFAPPALRRALVLAAAPPPGFRVGVDAAYSEYGAWHLLGEVISAVRRQSARHILVEEVLTPLGVVGDLFVGFDDAAYDAALERLAVNLDMHQRRRRPLLMERTRRVCTDKNVALGGYGCARGLALFYQSLLEGGRGVFATGPEVDFAVPQRPAAWDPVLERQCTFGLGFMVALDAHHFSRYCSASGFGHSGFGGLSCGFADPAADLAVGLVFNGRVDTETSIVHRRRTCLDAIYRGLGRGTRPGSGSRART